MSAVCEQCTVITLSERRVSGFVKIDACKIRLDIYSVRKLSSGLALYHNYVRIHTHTCSLYHSLYSPQG